MKKNMTSITPVYTQTLLPVYTEGRNTADCSVYVSPVDVPAAGYESDNSNAATLWKNEVPIPLTDTAAQTSDNSEYNTDN